MTQRVNEERVGVVCVVCVVCVACVVVMAIAFICIGSRADTDRAEPGDLHLCAD